MPLVVSFSLPNGRKEVSYRRTVIYSYILAFGEVYCVRFLALGSLLGGSFTASPIWPAYRLYR
jgi:hypothetical protein